MSNNNDYVAHRTLIATPRGIGAGTTTSITDKVIGNNLNYRNLFYNPLPNQVFVNREVSAINKAIGNINAVNNWTLNDTLNVRAGDIDQLLLLNFTQNEVDNWRNYLAAIPIDMTLSELKEYLETDSEVMKESILNAIFTRMQQLNQQQNNPLDKIRIMSFHSSKGLSAKVVFIPGLEEGIFPTVRTQQAPGLLLENARLFYVAITRAKASCILSYSLHRTIQGQYTNMAVSRFAQATRVVFNTPPTNQLTPVELANIQTAINDL
jgi:DNA helicase-2/ATP-dependent DNA helicase PcrA